MDGHRRQRRLCRLERRDANWNGAGAYTDLAAVVFPEGVANANITIASSVAPSSITFNNATTVYSFSGGAIAGATGMTLNGGGLVILSNRIPSSARPRSTPGRSSSATA